MNIVSNAVRPHKHKVKNAAPPHGEAARQFTDHGGVSYSIYTVAQMNIRDVQIDVFTQYLLKLLKHSTKLSERQECKKLFVQKLRKFGFHGEADDLEKCCANYSSLVCENGHSFNSIPDFRCHLPFCPDCWELKSNRELHRNLPKFWQALKDDPSLIVAFNTLTLKSDKNRGLRSGCKELKADFRKLRKREIWANVKGGFGRIENDYSHKFGWHPHLHCLLLLKNYIPQKEISRNWHEVTGDSMVVDIRQVYDIASGLVETIKYPFKPADLKKLGKPQIQEMLDLKGERLGLSFGVLFGLETEEDIEQQFSNEYGDFVDETKNLKIGDSCPICSTRLDLIDFAARDYVNFLASVPVSAAARGKPN
jgi:hypothetical protein